MIFSSSSDQYATDEVDPELIAQPTRWDIGFIRKFMLFFGPISSLFDFATFGIMLWVFHAGEALFQTGWFVESLATQTLVIFVIRTRRVLFFRSVASAPMALAAVGITAIGAVLPYTGRLAHILGFRPLPTTSSPWPASWWYTWRWSKPANTGSTASTTPPPRPPPGPQARLPRAPPGRFTARTLHPADRPDPDQANRKRPESASATGVPGDAPGVPLDGKHGTSAPTA